MTEGSLKALDSFRGFGGAKWYLITPLGRIFSLKSNRLLSTYVCRDGYEYTQLSICNKKFKLAVHRAVWMYFYGDIPDNLEINHIDGNKLNNCISNLECVTSSENKLHSYRVGLRTGGVGSGYSQLVEGTKLLDNKVLTFNSIVEAAKTLKLDPSSITKVCKGKLKSCGGFSWRYISPTRA